MTQTPQQERVDTEHLRDYSQLRRSVTDRKIAGVAGGLGRHLNIDPTVIRVLLVVLCFFGGAGLLLYAALWAFVPEEGTDQAPVATNASTRNAILAVFAALAGLLVIGDAWGPFGFPWPLAIVALVALFFLMNRGSNVSTTSSPPPEATPPTGAGATAAAARTDEPTAAYGAPPPWAPPPPTQPSQPPVPTRRGPVLFWITLALVAIALGILGMFDVAGASVPDAAYPALALTVVGSMLLVGAWFGRAGGLIALGVVTALVLAAVALGNPGYEGARDSSYRPTSASEVQSRYSVPAGRIDLDLSDVRDLENLDGRTIEVRANAGELRVNLPEGVDAVVDAEISGAGEANVLGRRSGGPSVDLERTIDGGADAPQIELDLHLIVGSIEVNQS